MWPAHLKQHFPSIWKQITLCYAMSDYCFFWDIINFILQQCYQWRQMFHRVCQGFVQVHAVHSSAAWNANYQHKWRKMLTSLLDLTAARSSTPLVWLYCNDCHKALSLINLFLCQLLVWYYSSVLTFVLWADHNSRLSLKKEMLFNREECNLTLCQKKYKSEEYLTPYSSYTSGKCCVAWQLINKRLYSIDKLLKIVVIFLSIYFSLSGDFDCLKNHVNI